MVLQLVAHNVQQGAPFNHGAVGQPEQAVYDYIGLHAPIPKSVPVGRPLAWPSVAELGKPVLERTFVGTALRGGGVEGPTPGQKMRPTR